MAFEQKPNSGSLFINERKESDTHPDRTGSALIDGKAYWVNGWIKEGEKGKWLSLSFKPKEAAPARKIPAAKVSERGVSARSSQKDDEDFIPF